VKVKRVKQKKAGRDPVPFLSVAATAQVACSIYYVTLRPKEKFVLLRREEVTLRLTIQESAEQQHRSPYTFPMRSVQI
jgi:hypothetical protein